MTHLQADYFYFQLLNFPQFTADWLVLVGTLDREPARDIGTGGILKEESAEASNENKSTETECLTFSCEYLSSNVSHYSSFRK